MLSIELRFPTGRYHATPWDQHVNEGGVEWPPSPWRLLRALAATWHLKACEDIDATRFRELVEALATQWPTYKLPRAVGAHTRHYMPIGKLDKGREKTTKVFDTFVHLGKVLPVVVSWPQVNLGESQEATLRLLLSRISYFGRAESWVEAVVAMNDDLDANGGMYEVVPLAAGAEPGADEELIRVLCPLPSSAIAAWRSRTFEEAVERALAKKRGDAKEKGKDSDKVKVSKSDKDKLDAALPRDLMAALEADTGELHKQGWSRVPGTQWVDYVRPRDVLTNVPTTRPACVSSPLPTTARFAVASNAPPRLTECLSFASRVRRALMSRSTGARVFAGKDAQGKPLEGNRHGFIFPEANGRHGRITHVTVYAPMGFDDTARRSLDGLRGVWGRGGHDVQLVLLGVGQSADFGGTNVTAGQCPLLAEGDIWISRTPFIPTRHPKTRRSGEPKLDEHGLQIGSPEHDLRRLLQGAGSPAPVSVQSVQSTKLGGKTLSWLEFNTLRHEGYGARSMNRGFGFRLVFPEPVRGPIAVGYGAHFGMGSFGPEAG